MGNSNQSQKANTKGCIQRPRSFRETGFTPFESVQPTNTTAGKNRPRSGGGEERHCETSDEAVSGG